VDLHGRACSGHMFRFAVAGDTRRSSLGHRDGHVDDHRKKHSRAAGGTRFIAADTSMVGLGRVLYLDGVLNGSSPFWAGVALAARSCGGGSATCCFAVCLFVRRRGLRRSTWDNDAVFARAQPHDSQWRVAIHGDRESQRSRSHRRSWRFALE
jgi:hypothetical protein